MLQAGSGVLSSLLGVPNFILYVLVGSALLAIFVVVYVRCTAHDEWALIRQGNLTASIALSGTMIGFVIPLSKAIAQASSIPDLLVWGMAAFVVQLAAYGVARLLVPDLSAKIESNTAAAGTILAGVSITSGMLNAAAMTV